MKAISYIIAGLLALCLSYCGPAKVPQEIDAKMIDSFLTSALVNASPHLRVRPEALTRDFILYGAYIPMLNSTTGHSLKGRVVRFKLAADRLIMLESPQGYTLSNGHDSFILLAEFPIVRQDDDGVIIDFAKGMSNVFTMRNVHSVSVADKASPQTAVSIPLGVFVCELRAFYRSGWRSAHCQPCKTGSSRENQKSELASAEFRYYFREYLPSPTYHKRTFGKNRSVQLFFNAAAHQAAHQQSLCIYH